MQKICFDVSQDRQQLGVSGYAAFFDALENLTPIGSLTAWCPPHDLLLNSVRFFSIQMSPVSSSHEAIRPSLDPPATILRNHAQSLPMTDRRDDVNDDTLDHAFQLLPVNHPPHFHDELFHVVITHRIKTPAVPVNE